MSARQATGGAGIAVCLLTSLLAAGPAAANLLLVEGGKPSVQLVLPADADETEKLAAEELNAYLAKSTGALLPVVGSAAPGTASIQLGVRDAALRRELQLGDLAFDGFVVDCNERHLLLAGNVPEGTLNAVYWFLEEVIGVRWYLPTKLGENVPRHPTIRVPPMRRRVEPRFVNRRNHGIDLSIPGEGATWRRRVRITSHGLNVPFNRYSHNLYTVVKPSLHGQSHPEYFPLLGRARYLPATDHAPEWQPCTSSPEVVALTIAAARRWFREHPEANFFSVGMNDSGRFCECRKCVARDLPSEEFRGRPMVSDRYFGFVKQVAEAIRESHPEKFVTCIAYSKVESPPKHVRLPSNVGVVITQDVAQWHDADYKQADMDFARRWAEAAGAFGTYDYTGLTWLMPRVYPHAMAESLRFYDSIGAVAVTNEAYPTWWYAAPQMYLRAKLMWDPTLDVDGVLDDFYSGFFGPAHAEMKRLYDVFERCLMRERPGQWFEGLSSVLQQMDLWTRDDLAECRSALAAANQRVSGREPFAARIDMVARGFSFTEALLEEYWQAQRVRELAGKATRSSGDTLAEVQALRAKTAAREAVWDSIRDDRLVSGIYRLIFDRFQQRLATWRSFLQGSTGIGVSRLVMVPGGLSAEELRDLLPTIPAGALRDELRGHLWTREHPDAPNLCRNAAFEETNATGPAPEGVDWVSTDTPPAWSKWAINPENRPNLTWEERGGREDSRCVRLAGAEDACFIQLVPAKAGAAYHVSAWAKSEGTDEAQTRLVVQWKDADGKWVWSQPRREAGLHGATAEWRRLSLVLTIPEGVANAVVLLSAKDQQPGDVARFDDVRMVRLPDQ